MLYMPPNFRMRKFLYLPDHSKTPQIATIEIAIDGNPIMIANFVSLSVGVPRTAFKVPLKARIVSFTG